MKKSVSERNSNNILPDHGSVAISLSISISFVIMLWSLFDQRLLNEFPVYAKPMKFAASFVMLFITIHLAYRRFSDRWKLGTMLNGLWIIMTLIMMLEMYYIVLMAARQEASHFNFTSDQTELLYQLMGVGSIVLIASVGIFGVVALIDRNADFSPVVRQGIGWGFILSFALTLPIAGYMSISGTHIGSPEPGSQTLPPFGWSATVGDLRPAHFLALHAMQALPLAALLMERYKVAPSHLRWLALVYVLATVAILVQALLGLPLIRL